VEAVPPYTRYRRESVAKSKLWQCPVKCAVERGEQRHAEAQCGFNRLKCGRVVERSEGGKPPESGMLRFVDG
jgi:hypothetical protein